MFDEKELDDIIELHGRTYELIRWVGDAVRRGFIRFERAHDYATEAETAQRWLKDHYANLPVACRPLHTSGPQFERYANLFVSYLQASLELAAEPKVRIVTDTGCYCSFCRWLAAVSYSESHLAAKKVRPKDKVGARKLKQQYLADLAHELGQSVELPRLDELIDDPVYGKDVALATYSDRLIARSKGIRATPTVLALWREIAWTKQGSPNHKFRLRAKDIIKAEQRLAEALS